jgi:hypothetical protein
LKKNQSLKKSKNRKERARPNYGGARENAGRPAFEPTDAERKQVEALSGYGLPIEQIAVPGARWHPCRHPASALRK